MNRNYFERIITCDCGQFQRQTAINIPLDSVGEQLSNSQVREFVNREDLGKKHRNCNDVKFSSWRVVTEL